MPPEVWPSDTIFPSVSGPGYSSRNKSFLFAECLQARRKRQYPTIGRINAVDLPYFSDISVFLEDCEVFFALASSRPAADCRCLPPQIRAPQIPGPGNCGIGFSVGRCLGLRVASGSVGARCASPPRAIRAGPNAHGFFLWGVYRRESSSADFNFFSSSSFCVELICADAFCRRSSGMTTLDTRRR